MRTKNWAKVLRKFDFCEADISERKCNKDCVHLFPILIPGNIE
jgi:hypothetical protein